MIVRWPGKVAAGTVNDQVWAFWDMLPTLAELGGGKAPEGLDGLSMVPALLGSRPGRPTTSSSTGSSTKTASSRRCGWATGRPSGSGPGGPIELYDLKTDIGETHDVAAEHPEVVARIEAYLKSAQVDSADFPIVEPGTPAQKKARRATPARP